MHKTPLLFLMLFIGLVAEAQISVKSFRALPTDMTASSLKGKRIDQNGEVSALIKVVTTETDFIFEGGVLGIVDTKQQTGEIWVWVPHSLRKITVKHQRLGVLREYYFPLNIEAERTYEMVLLTGKVETVVNPAVTQNERVDATTDPTAIPPGAIDGLFSVSPSNQVMFSQGNLQYIGSAPTPYWKFADHQWDCFGTTTSQNSSRQNADRDLFGWGTSGFNHGANGYQPLSISITNSDYYAYGQDSYNLNDQTGRADWGFNAISNGGNQTGRWRTLTHEEWQYVFNTRSTPSSIRYAKAIVNDVRGIVLLPDDWSISYYSLNKTNNNEADFRSNKITSAQWDVLEQHGAVFLPAAGYRNGTSVREVGSTGSYWSASCNGNYQAWTECFYGTLFFSFKDGRSSGNSVRLVCSPLTIYTISVRARPSKEGNVSGGGTFINGQSCTVTASSDYTFLNWTENGEVVSTDAEYTFTVTENRTLVAHFNYQPKAPNGAINGQFSVSSSEQVWFSQGNLQYIGSASAPYWKFAEHQWDCLGTTTNQNSKNQNVDRDLFAWGTNGFDQEQWRTLTHEEWQYVLETRKTTNGIRYAKAVVNNVNGVILLPDDWSDSYYSLNNANQGGANYSSNTITPTQWATLEQHGAVFLPASGSQNGSSVNYVGSGGYYWSASYINSNVAWLVGFSETNLNTSSSGNRGFGQSVRLVCSD